MLVRMAPRRARDVNLKLLRTFDAVARHSAFGKAAVELGRSPATVSLQVQELETQLGARLLVRTTRKVDLTDVGRAFAQALHKGFQEIDAGLALVREHKQGREDHVVMACVPSLSATCLPNVLGAFQRTNPQVRVDVHELTAPELFEAVSTGSVEFALGPRAETIADIAFAPIIEDEICVVLSKRWAVEAGDGSFQSLSKVPILTLSGSALLQQQLEETADRLGLSLKFQSEVRHVPTAIAMARAGIGVAIVPRLSLAATGVEDLVISPLVEPRMVRHICLITRHGAPLSRVGSRLARFIRANLQQPVTAKTKAS